MIEMTYPVPDGPKIIYGIGRHGSFTTSYTASFCFVFNKPDVQHNSDTVNTVNSILTCWFVSLFVGINIDWCMCCGAISIPAWDVRNGVLVNVKGTCSIRSIFALNNRWNVEWNSILLHNFSMEWTRLEYCLAFRIHLIISNFNTEDLPSTKPLTYNWNILFEYCNATLRQVNIIVTYFDSLTPRNIIITYMKHKVRVLVDLIYHIVIKYD